MLGLVEVGPAGNINVSQFLESLYRTSPQLGTETFLKPDQQATQYSALTGDRRPLRIPAVELRGILIHQLLAIVSFLTALCTQDHYIEGFVDRNGRPLRVSDVDLYVLTENVIKPMTSHDKVSYVEAVATEAEKQVPKWFVSHYWGEKVLEFIRCLQKHAAVRGLSESLDAYWVCAYANNQHELETAITKDPMESSFLKALALAVGVLLILDPLATPFKRLWCMFEEGILIMLQRGLLTVAESDGRTALKSLLDREPLLLDIGTVKDDKAELLTQGLSSAETADETRRPGDGFKSKNRRERTFPVERIKYGLDVSLSQATASREQDDRRIRNALALRAADEIDELAPADHPNYKEIEKALASTFAVAAWGKTQAGSPEFLTCCSQALPRDNNRSELDWYYLARSVKVEL